MTRKCKQCVLEKNIMDFRHQVKNDKINISLVCKKCDYKNSKERHLKFRETHREKLRQMNKEYYLENRLEIKIRQRDKKPIWDHNYYIKNKKRIQENQLRRTKERYQSEPNFRIRKTVSKAISRTLRLRGCSKNGNSCLSFLPYTMQKLKEHLEKQFEPWMSWHNYGILKNWNDNDSSTWKWQIDHIIPHSTFKYISMEDQSFQECWALNNLRPLSAKINNFDGTHRVRHGVL